MKKLTLEPEGHIDPTLEFGYKHITNYQEAFPILHDHNFYEFFIILEGSITHLINEQQIILRKGHMVFIRPEDVHSFSRNNEEVHFINLAISNHTINELFTYLGKEFNKREITESALPPTFLLNKIELQDILSQFEQLSALPLNDKSKLNIELRCLLVNLFTRYFFNTRKKTDNVLPDWLHQVTEEMKKPANFKEGITAVKRLSCKSDEHISRSFRKYLKMSPTQYVNQLRLNYAANQIRFSNKSITDIGFESGFENHSYFHRQFKSTFDITPNEFRKANFRS